MRLVLGIMAIAASAVLGSSVAAAQDRAAGSKALTILSSPSAETQFMALVLAGAVMEKGMEMTILLCDQAGDLALTDEKAPQQIAIAPPRKTPRDLLMSLMSKGAKVEVCAIYLPNRPYEDADLVEGVSIATPPAMGTLMADPAVRVFTF